MVYCFGSEEYGWYKIGMTRSCTEESVRAREMDLKTGVPFKAKMVKMWHSAWSLELEQWLHHKFADRRTNGEWFSLSPDLVAHIDVLVKDFHRYRRPRPAILA